MFEFDENKSKSNKLKHGIDFIDAQELWKDLAAIEVSLATPEPRWLILGAIKDVVWAAIITYRHQKIRIISCRRARTNERAQYENQKT